MFLRALAAIAVLLLASCGSLRLPEIKPYRMEIQQGNFVSQDMVSQLKPGMTKDQVRFVLGTPLITDSFHADRWDYVFRRQMANSTELEHRRIAVFFEDGKLKRVAGDVTPAAEAGAAAVKAPPQAATDKPAAQAGSATSKAAPSANAPASPAQAQPQEKSWWQKLKEKF